ncbi:M81 family metallopeptidase [Roseomonas marmotae]|uniref:Microcystinase C n=1 Tax=Roseomonas marmotae TaxID=2768161 RepID=A0ABS3K9W8_9PROT|nr:M81 family metallopeptidase [Roseomonas marmotae]MBO1073730.1 M81 family metallopeptidase [Roseomonas marmotae]QTI78636.1 M81 family metallopeptidase [Roseomonas marmotae]
MRIAIVQVSHETNTFSSELTDQAAFSIRSWIEGAEILRRHRGVRDYIGGMIDEAEALGGIELLPTFAAITSPSGYIRAETWSEIKRRVLAGLKAVAPVDAICLELHGAGIAESTGDIEGDLLRTLRLEFGAALPIAATLDLHGNITERMIDNADMLFGVKEYPHIDMYDRGRDAIRNLDLMVRGVLKPSMALTRLPMVIPTTTTFHGPLKAVNARCAEWEAKPGIVHCAAYHGFPYGDSPATCVSVIAIADNDEALAQQATRDVADFIWNQRDAFAVSLPGAAEGLETALACPESPVIVNETSDNPGAGAPGDGTWLLAEMLRRNVAGTCFAHLADAEVVAAAHQAGEGARIRVRLGGKVDALHGAPLDVEAEVVMNTRCRFIASTPMGKGGERDYGLSTRLRIGNVDVIVTELKSQLLDDEMLKLHGMPMDRYKVIAIKSSQHFRAFFETAAARIVTVDTPGISTFNFDNFTFRTSVKYLYPLAH